MDRENIFTALRSRSIRHLFRGSTDRKFSAHSVEEHARTIEETDTHRENTGGIGLQEKKRHIRPRIFDLVSLQIPAVTECSYWHILDTERELLSDTENRLFCSEHCLLRNRFPHERDEEFKRVAHASAIRDSETKPALFLSLRRTQVHCPRFSGTE